ncbi:MAG TPA: lycopene cyclase domain-containing protein [Candidatus Dormibacteraeota bacterium]|jgi:lycopene cyclase domain-containing protein|nr:lycopene cyclase domain-containing protein [Candidatus Dormibacteraeota bacterium]
MIRFAYLAALLIAWAGVLILDGRLRLGVTGGRLVRCILVTVPLFLVFDGVGTARGWFASNPRLNSLIVPPGIPLEEPVLLAFLCLLSVVLRRVARRAHR